MRLTRDEFAGLMAAFGPYERAPVVAVATSGGGDSLALAVLAAEWAVERGGSAVALIVDHGLRVGSGEEAAGVARRLAVGGIRAEVLPWLGAKPATGIQAAARAARRGILADWCRRNGVLHLLLGHQRDDQVETHVMRRRRRSGPLGVAAMSAVVEGSHHRVLRPLLAVPGRRLRATLMARGWTWVEDPSNADPRFERTRVRRDLAGDPALAPRAIDRAVDRAGARRVGLDRDVAALLAGCLRFEPAGFARIARRSWERANPTIRALALRRVLLTIGGRDVPPGPDALRRLARTMAGTLAGCRVVGHGDEVIVCREPRGVAAPVALDGATRWDGRFRVDIATPRPDHTVGALGDDDARLAGRLPQAVRATLPCIRNLAGIVAVPHVRVHHGGTVVAADVAVRFDRSRDVARPFVPAVRPAAVPAATLAWEPGHAKILAIGAA